MNILGVAAIRKAVMVLASSVAAVLLITSPASAATNDSFTVWTLNGGCGAVDFVDYGTMNGSNNDDFAVVHDYCADGHGVRAHIWLTDIDGYTRDLGTKYNGLGYSGPPVYWDPFAAHGNVYAGDVIKMQVCLVDGATDPTPFSCNTVSRMSFDG